MKPVALSWTLSDVAHAVGGELFADPTQTIDIVSTDSRSRALSALFVALVGDTFDGHDFAQDAFGVGAVAVLVNRDSGIDIVARIEVNSTSDALIALGAKRRAEIHVPTVAVTGTSGKTGTKDLLAAGIVGSWASPSSFNNEIGVPLTVLGTPDDATALVLEVGSRGVGHIALLSDVLAPDVSVITNLGVGHMETFGTPRKLRDAKYEVIEMLPEGGIAVVPVDEPSLRARTGLTTLTFGFESGDVAPDIAVGNLRVDGNGFARFTLRTPDGAFEIAPQAPGLHQAANVAAAVGAALACGIPLDTFVPGMEAFTGAAWRMNIHRGTFTVVNDTYNANPKSVENALRTVASMDGRHVAVLGAMAELGPLCEQEHEVIGRLVSELGFVKLIVVGPDHGYGVGFGSGVVNAADIVDAADTLKDIVEAGDVVLVKASRAASLERLALQLIEDSGS